MLSDADLERFSRQLLLADFSVAQQERLASARVLVVGCGGLGNPAALYLAAAGVGALILADGDSVELSNLHRQVLYGSADVGLPKADRAAAALQRLGPACRLEVVRERLAGDALIRAVAAADVVLDGSDNYPTRHALNRACIAAARPLVSAAAARGEGQLATYDVARGTACYRCVYPDQDRESALACRDNGVLGPVVGVFGALQALEVIKVVTGWGESLRGRMLVADLSRYELRVLDVARRPACPDCGDA